MSNADETQDEVYRRTLRWEIAKRVLIIITTIVVLAQFGYQQHQNGKQLDAIRATQKTNVTTLAQIKATSTQAKRAADAATATSEQIADCLNPDGKCGRRSKDATAAVVEQIKQVTIFTAACSKRYPLATVDQLKACVAELSGHPAKELSNR
jgi:hypothetical protein